MSAPAHEPPPSMRLRETLAVMRRALRFAGEMKARFAVKLIAGALAFIPVVVLPLFGKVLIDHVIFGAPVEGAKYPPFFQPFVRLLYGRTPSEIALLVCAALAVMVLVFGGRSMMDQHRLLPTSTNLDEGSDIATRSDNDANVAASYCGGVLGWFSYQWQLRISQLMNHRFRYRLFERVLHLPMTRLDEQRIGDAVYRTLYDTAAVTQICYSLILTSVLAPLNMFMVGYVIWYQFPGHWSFLWISLASMPLALLLTGPFAHFMRTSTARARAAGAAATSTLEEGVSNVLAVQSLGAQQRERDRFEADSWAAYRAARRLFVLSAGLLWGALLVILVLGFVVVYEITDALFAKEITVGDAGMCMWLFLAMQYGARDLGVAYVVLQNNVVGAKRAFELMDAAVESRSTQHRPLPEVRDGFALEGVGLVYPGGHHALDAIDLQAGPGNMIALVGPAGAGKTSLAYMFPRFLSPTRGRITLDGHDLSEFDRDALRNQIAFVFQEPVLFDASVAENIRIGKPDATDAQVRRAAELARVADFVERMPRGYDTLLGRGGGRLSVGQKQRLSIARALVRDAPVLILDEPSSALDPETELHLTSVMREASRTRLVIVIAHRLSTIQHADRIVFLEAGAIREQGSHQELMARPGGAYRRFVALQAGA